MKYCSHVSLEGPREHPTSVERSGISAAIGAGSRNRAKHVSRVLVLVNTGEYTRVHKKARKQGTERTSNSFMVAVASHGGCSRQKNVVQGPAVCSSTNEIQFPVGVLMLSKHKRKSERGRDPSWLLTLTSP